jgi:hypothetical protein
MSRRTWSRLLVLSALLVVLGFALPALTGDAPRGKNYALLIGVRDQRERSTPGHQRPTAGWAW